MTDIGKISFVYKGDYDELTTYEEKDCEIGRASCRERV